MKTRIQEHDFDFKKTVGKSDKPSSDFLYTGIVTIMTGVLFFMGVHLFSIPEQPVKKDKVSFVEYQDTQSLSFKSINPSSVVTLQNSIKDIFSINAAVYPDHATVRTGIIDEKLDKIQGHLLKDISNTVRNTQFTEPLSIDTSADRISLLSFDSINRTMTFEIKYSLNVKSNEKSPKSLNFLKISHGMSHIQVTFDKFSNLQDIQLTDII